MAARAQVWPGVSTATDSVAERYLEAFATLDPCAATELGIVGDRINFDEEITDYSPDGVTARTEAARSALAELDTVQPVDEVDTVTIAAMRDVFDLMPTDTDADWSVIAHRLGQIPQRATGYAQAMRAAAASGHPPADRQVARGIEQATRTQQLVVDMVAGEPSSDRMLNTELQRCAVAAAAARVVIDIGVHCQLGSPDGGTWNAEKAWDFLTAHFAQSEETLRFELDRYLGWPGQAPSYAVGQRIWQQLRNQMTASGLTLRQFHGRALDLGSLGLDVLRSALTAS